jgi:hypothetical protein
MLPLVEKLLNSYKGNLVISAILGFSLAIIFKPVCKKNCILYISPTFNKNLEEEYNIEGICYKNNIIPHKCKNNLEYRI